MSADLEAPCAVLFDVGNTILAERRFDLVEGINAVLDDRNHSEELADTSRAKTIEHHRQNREILLGQWLKGWCRSPSWVPGRPTPSERGYWRRMIGLTF